MNLDKFTKYIKENPCSDDTKLKRLNKLKERELLNTKEQFKKINKLMDKRDILVEGKNDN